MTDINFKAWCAVGFLVFGSIDAFVICTKRSFDTTKSMSDVKNLQCCGHFSNLEILKIDPNNLGLLMSRFENERLFPHNFPELTVVDVIGSLPWSMIKELPKCFPQSRVFILDKPDFSGGARKAVDEYVHKHKRTVILESFSFSDSSDDNGDSECSPNYGVNTKICEVRDRNKTVVKVKLTEKEHIDEEDFKKKVRKMFREKELIRYIEEGKEDKIWSLLKKDPSLKIPPDCLNNPDISKLYNDFKRQREETYLKVYDNIKGTEICEQLGINEENAFRTIEKNKYILFKFVVKENNLDLIKLLMEIGINIDIVDKKGNPALFWTKDLKMMKTLIELGANVNYTNKKTGCNLLTRCLLFNISSQEMSPLVKLILEKIEKSKINEPTKGGNTALHIAVHRGYGKIAKKLIDNGADISVKDRKKKTPFMRAVQFNEKDIVGLFLTVFDKDNSKAVEELKCAMENGREKGIDVLLDKVSFSEEQFIDVIKSVHSPIPKLILGNAPIRYYYPRQQFRQNDSDDGFDISSFSDSDSESQKT